MDRLWDCHAHLIPGLDDGAQDFSETADMLQAAAHCGITDIIATPHLKKIEQMQEQGHYLELLEQTRQLAAPLGLRIHRGYEVNYRILAQIDLDTLKQSCIEDSNFLLLELSSTNLLPNWERVISSLVRGGFRVMLVHPERYLYFQEHPSLLEDFLSYGLLAQIDAHALFQGMFSQERYTAQTFLKRHQAACIASDAHCAKDYKDLQKALRKYGPQFFRAPL